MGSIPPSLVRTATPFLAGLLGAWLLRLSGWHAPTPLLESGITAVIGYGYYAAARFLEVFVSDKWGYVLGFRAKPVYPGKASVGVGQIQTHPRGRHAAALPAAGVSVPLPAGHVGAADTGVMSSHEPLGPDFSTHQLGRRPAVDKPALMLREVLTGVLPDVPVAADHFAKVPSWELGGNDRYGTCGPTSVANDRRLVTTALTGSMQPPSLEDVFDLYRRSGNPHFDPAHPGVNDGGVVMQTMLEALLAGGIGGVKPVAFAKIAPGDDTTLEAAIAIFGGVLLGLDLEVAQQRQPVWDYSKGSTPWGGHAVLAGKYSDPAGDSQDRTDVITWANDLPTTRAFIEHQEAEAWVVIWPEHLGSEAFLQGVDGERLAEAFKALTGEDLPLPTPPAPTPAPAPAPAPTPEPPAPAPAPAGPDPEDAVLAAALHQLLDNKDVPHYMRAAGTAWLEAKGL